MPIFTNRPRIERPTPGSPPAGPDPADLITVSEAAKLLRLSRRTVERLVGRGVLPFYTLPIRGGLRFARADVLGWLAGQYKASLG